MRTMRWLRLEGWSSRCGLVFERTFKTIRRLLVMGAAMALLYTVWSQAVVQAAEGGASEYALGFISPQAGYLPDPGAYFGYNFYYYNGDANAGAGRQILGGHGSINVNASLETTVPAQLFSLTYVFDHAVLGGHAGVGLIVPYLPIDLDVSASGSINLPNNVIPLSGSKQFDNDGMGDIIFTPMIGWHRNPLHYIALINVYTPTGKYDVNDVVNPGQTWAESFRLNPSALRVRSANRAPGVAREPHMRLWADEPLLAQAEPDSVGYRHVVAEEKEKTGELTLEEIAELIANPFSYLWFGMIQNDTYWYSGHALDLLNEGDKIVNSTLIQPVMSFALSEKWRVISRPVFPIVSVDTVSGFNFITDEPEGPRITADFKRKTGLGDIVLWNAFSPKYTPPLVYGFGPTIMMDTASDKWLGTGKWSAGPMGTIAYITDKWIVAGVAQHWWSFAGDSDRNDVNLTSVQPIVRYRLSKTTNIGIAPDIRCNWAAPHGGRWTVPLGGGISTVFMLGKLPVGVGAEYYYYVERPDILGPEHQVRFFITPVLPAPKWSRKPIIGH